MPMMLLQVQRTEEPQTWTTLLSARNNSRGVDEMNRLIDQLLNEVPTAVWVDEETDA